MGRQIIKQIIKNRPPTFELPEWIATELERIEKIKADLEFAAEEEVKILKESNLAMRTVDGLRVSARSRCKHEVEEYISDPSGGSDRSYKCQICGRER